jgi:myosin heavy subunit
MVYQSEFRVFENCMKQLFSPDFIVTVYKVLEAILLIGNIQFKPNKSETEPVQIEPASLQIIHKISSLLDLNLQTETESTLQVFCERLTCIVS